MDTAKHTAYWRDSAGEDWSAAKALLERGHLRHGLFFVHLAIEKTLKACVVSRTQKMPPKTHDLLRLSSLAGLTPSGEQSVSLTLIGRYCMEGRYPDSWGGSPDEEEASDVVIRAQEISKWLETLFET
ncbi:MAG: HEPN domain-containing protein [Myxococcota bacterium]|jgi:HEPN domain-containing protein|nr:HEPN domain-containing protein [Myxococcota bacterium]